MYSGEKIVPIKLDLRVNHTLVKDQFLWDSNNFESDPKEFARLFCKDTGIEDPEVGPAIAFAIREQLNEIAIQSVVSARESRMSKKGRKERSGTYRNLLSTYYPTRKLMPLKQRKREISGEFTLWSATPHQKEFLIYSLYPQQKRKKTAPSLYIFLSNLAAATKTIKSFLIRWVFRETKKSQNCQ
ncbi:Chromatin structure-remodeling complex protein BSH [Glycine max]|nr:Chromatin structure-remodeling complex protein BSH [Glycine max]